MRGVLKWSVIIVLAVMMLALVTIVGALYLIDPNQFKDELAQAVKTQTGRDLSIEGDIEISVFPWLGFKIGESRLSNAAGFGDQPMLRIAHAEARVRLLSLLSREPEIATLVLQGLEARLARDARGQTNWADLSGAAQRKDATRPSDSAAAAPAFGFPTVAEIRIENAELLWEDALNDRRVRLHQVDMQTGTIALQQPVPLRLRLDIDSRQPDIRGEVTLQARAWADPPGQTYRLNAIEIRSRLRGGPRPGGALDARVLAEQLAANLAHETLELDGLEVHTDELDLTGRGDLREFAAPRVNFNLRSDSINVDRLLPPPPAADETRAPGTGAGAAAVLLPLQALRPLKLDGDVAIGTLVMSNLTLSEVRIKLTATDGLLTVHPQAALYQGHYRGDIRLDLRRDVGEITMQEELSAVQIEPLLQDFLHQDYLSGETHLQFRATARGNTLDNLLASLDGVAELRVNNAQLKSKHLLYDMARRLIKSRNLARPEEFDKQVTVFDTITGRFDIRDGVARNDDLLGRSERVHIRGEGRLNLVTQEADYTAYLIPKKSLRIPWVGGEELDLKDQPIPYHVHGPLDNLQFDPDFEEVIKRLGKQRLESIKKQKEAELKRELKEKQAQEQQKLEQKLEQEKRQLEDKLKNKLLDKLR